MNFLMAKRHEEVVLQEGGDSRVSGSFVEQGELRNAEQRYRL